MVEQEARGRRRPPDTVRFKLKPTTESERALQRAIVKSFRAHARPPGLIFSVPNDNRRGPGDAANVKALGLHAGAADLIVIGPKAVIFLEVKTDRGELSKAQESFRQSVEENGHPYEIARSVDEAVAAAERIAGLEFSNMPGRRREAG